MSLTDREKYFYCIGFLRGIFESCPSILHEVMIPTMIDSEFRLQQEFIKNDISIHQEHMKCGSNELHTLDDSVLKIYSTILFKKSKIG